MKNLKLSVIIAMIAMAMTSCVKNQTAFDFEDVPYYATIIGNVTYNDGYRIEENTTSTIEAKGLCIHVTVNNSDYSTKSGKSVFFTNTDEKGNFKISIPCTLSGVSATITTDDFINLYYNSPGTYTYRIYTLSSPKTITNLTPNSIKACVLTNFDNKTADPTIR